MKHPAAVTACNLDLENLITDSNRSIATLAITTLLKVKSYLTPENCHNTLIIFRVLCPSMNKINQLIIKL